MTQQVIPSQNSEEISDDVVKLIAKQRLLRLIDGGRFLKYSAKGQRIKDKYWCCKLSENKRTLHFGDLDDLSKDPSIDELQNRINVSDIKGILIGKDCPHTKDSHMKKSLVDSAFSVIHESGHDEYLNFVAVDNKTFCYWTDGINALLKNNMSSDEFSKDLQILSDVESKIMSMNKSTSQVA